MGITEVASDRQLRVKLLTEIQTDIAGSRDPIAGSSTPAYTWSPHPSEHTVGKLRESHIIRVVDSSHQSQLIVVDKTVHHEVSFVPVFATVTGKSVSEPALLHAGLDNSALGILFNIDNTSVTKSKQRIKKKLGLGPNDVLETFLNENKK